MLKKIPIYLFLAGGLFSIAACNRAPENAYKATIVFKNTTGEPVARVGDFSLTQNYLELQLPSYKAEQFNSDAEKKTERIEAEIREEILFQEALRKNYLNDPNIQKDIKKILVKKIIKDEKKRLDATIKNTEEELNTYYQQHFDNYNWPEKINSAYIYIPFGKDKKAALKKANEAYKKVLANKGNQTHFLSVAIEYSSPENFVLQTKEETIKDIGQKQAEALWAINQDNTASPILASDSGYYILYRAGKREAKTTNFAEVKDTIDNLIKKEKRKAAFTNLLEDLKKTYSVEIYKDRVAKLVLSSTKNES